MLLSVVVGCSAPAALPTASALPSPTPPATATPLAPTNTVAPTATPPPTFTPEPKPTHAPLKTDEHRAPNGWWSAQGWGEFRDDTYHAELRAARADGQVSWTASQEWNAGLGVPLPTPLAWSQDGRYLYYTNIPLVDGCALFVNGSDLWRMDLTDGAVTQLVPDVGLAVSLAPDEKTFAYIGYGPQPALVLRDLATGDERRAPLPADTQAGGIVWSLDSSVLMLTVAEKACSGEEAISVLKMQASTLTPVAWPLEYSVRRNSVAGLQFIDPTTSVLHGRTSWAIYPSPSRQWVALALDRISKTIELAVARADGSKAWVAKQDHIYEGALLPLQWSPDERYLYFTLIPGIDGGCQTWQTYGTSIQRLDVETGCVTELIRGDLRAMSISPNTKWLAHLEDKNLAVRDLTTGTEEAVKIKILDDYTKNDEVAVDYLTWSTDSRSVMLMVEVNSCDENSLYALVRVDRQTLSQTIVIQDISQRYEILDWTDDGIVWLRDENWVYWQLNPLTGALTTPTLVPQTLGPN